jgi:hypothetical protein
MRITFAGVPRTRKKSMRYVSLLLSFAVSIFASVRSESAEYEVPGHPNSPSANSEYSEVPNSAISRGAEDDSSFIAKRTDHNFYSSTVAQDHEAAGIEIRENRVYTDVMALHIVYPPSSIALEAPPYATKTQILYAPTTRPPNGSCLEVGTKYRTPPNQRTTAAIYVYDFCGGGFVEKQEHQVDDWFLSTYATVFRGGYFAYQVSITRTLLVGSQTPIWTAWLYNVKTGKWNKYYEQTGVHSDKRGWTIFESYFMNGGQCPKNLPPFVAWDIKFRNQDSSRWDKALPSNDIMPTEVRDGKTSHGGNTHCFVDDPTGLASFNFKELQNESGWRVWSTGH